MGGYESLLVGAIQRWVSDAGSSNPEVRALALSDLAAAKKDPAGIELLALLAGATRMPAAAILEAIADQIALAQIRPEPRPKPKALLEPKPAPRKVGRPKSVRPTFKVKAGQKRKAA